MEIDPELADDNDQSGLTNAGWENLVDRLAAIGGDISVEKIDD
jgi:hypothetical protein